MTSQITQKKAQQGVSLIEVLVAAIIIAIGLMGLAGMQTRSLQMNQSAYLRSQANYYAYEMVDVLRLHREMAKNEDFDIDMTVTGPTGDTIQDKEVKNWIDGISTTLPTDSSGDTGGAIDVTSTSDGAEVVIRVAWVDERWVEGATDAEKIRTVRLETEL